MVISLSCVVDSESARGSGASTTGRKEVNPSRPDYNAKNFNIRGIMGNWWSVWGGRQFNGKQELYFTNNFV